MAAAPGSASPTTGEAAAFSLTNIHIKNKTIVIFFYQAVIRQRTP